MFFSATLFCVLPRPVPYVFFPIIGFHLPDSLPVPSYPMVYLVLSSPYHVFLCFLLPLFCFPVFVQRHEQQHGRHVSYSCVIYLRDENTYRCYYHSSLYFHPSLFSKRKVRVSCLHSPWHLFSTHMTVSGSSLFCISPLFVLQPSRHFRPVQL